MSVARRIEKLQRDFLWGGMEIEHKFHLVVDSKYGNQEREWCSNRVREPHGMNLWKHIRAGWDGFSKHITYEVGDGSWIKFWHDIWPVQDWELEVVDSIMKLLYSHVIRPGCRDSFGWTPSQQGIFQDKWRVGKSFAFALPNCSGTMEFDFDFIWSSLGDALGCGRPSHLLE
uniref:Reverse transcriptase zinc-binding domain-containing protein n=1 Tax=Fagus sylvatica TaxID=28930 RepID=A0A2N9IF55_FAGSY